MIISLPSANADLLAVGRRLHEVREARGLGLEALAGAVGLTQAELSLAEHGRLRLNSVQMHAVTDALHVSPRIMFEPGIDVSRLRRL